MSNIQDHDHIFGQKIQDGIISKPYCVICSQLMQSKQLNPNGVKQ